MVDKPIPSTLCFQPLGRGGIEIMYSTKDSTHDYLPPILHKSPNAFYYNTPLTYTYTYLLFKYQLKANWLVSAANGVGTSPSPGLATGCLKYTAAHTF